MKEIERYSKISNTFTYVYSTNRADVEIIYLLAFFNILSMLNYNIEFS